MTQETSHMTQEMSHMTNLSVIFVFFQNSLEEFPLLLLGNDGFSDLPLGPVRLYVAQSSYPVSLTVCRLYENM